MHTLRIHKTGLGLGAFFALIHAGWSLLVASGKAGSMLDFVFGMHFLTNPYEVLSFSWAGALMLVVLTGIAGYVTGAVFAWVWNKAAAR